MNAVELLLKMDKDKVKAIPTKQVEVKRLSEIAGEPFTVTLKAVSGNKWSDIVETIGADAGNYKSSKHLLLVGMEDPKLSDHDLQEAYGAVTPLDLVEKLFLAGEIMSLAAEVTDLSGLGDDALEEVKN
jgi:hypothetical protein